MTSPTRISVIGTGYVGLTTAVCLASLGHTVTGVDSNPRVVSDLLKGRTDLVEPGLAALLRQGHAAEKLHFQTDPERAVTTAEIVILCLPTPSGTNGAADLTAIDATTHRIRPYLPPGAVVVTKSTVPVGTAARISTLLDRDDIAVVANPEFLREGHAVYDFLHPHRIVIGSRDPAPAKQVAGLYETLHSETIFTDPASAELAKYAANCFLATKLSYINTIAELCDAFGAHISDLIHILGTDPRIGSDYLRPGPGWGGPCLPKDTAALIHQARATGLDVPLLEATADSNTQHQRWIVERLRQELGGLHQSRIALLGLTFKAGTTDFRNSPAIQIAESLLDAGALITAHDPACQPELSTRLTVTATLYDAAHSADALLLLTDWPEYHTLDWPTITASMIGNILFDTRNALNPDEMTRAGLRYIGMGEQTPNPSTLDTRLLDAGVPHLLTSDPHLPIPQSGNQA